MSSILLDVDRTLIKAIKANSNINPFPKYKNECEGYFHFELNHDKNNPYWTIFKKIKIWIDNIIDVIKYDDNNLIIIANRKFRIFNLNVYKYKININELKLVTKLTVLNNNDPMILFNKDTNSIYVYNEDNGIYNYNFSKKEWTLNCHLKNKIRYWWIHNSNNIHYIDKLWAHWRLNVNTGQKYYVGLTLPDTKHVYVPQSNITISFTRHLSNIVVYTHDTKSYQRKPLCAARVPYLKSDFGVMYHENERYILLYNKQAFTQYLWFYDIYKCCIYRKNINYIDRTFTSKLITIFRYDSVYDNLLLVYGFIRINCKKHIPIELKEEILKICGIENNYYLCAFIQTVFNREYTILNILCDDVDNYGDNDRLKKTYPLLILNFCEILRRIRIHMGTFNTLESSNDNKGTFIEFEPKHSCNNPSKQKIFKNKQNKPKIPKKIHKNYKKYPIKRYKYNKW